MASVAKASLPVMLSRSAIRLGGMDALTRAAGRYAERIAKADTKPKALQNWLADTALVDECAAGQQSSQPDTAREWRSRVGYFKRRGEWCAPGPQPGQPGCKAPDDILAEFGFNQEAA